MPSSQHHAAGRRTVSLVTLGCARNEVDSEELAARLEPAAGPLTDGDEADVVLVNTCGFIEAAKQESIDELLRRRVGGAQVVAAGCLAERYGSGLAEALPEAQVLSFDDYGDIGARLDAVVAGERWPAHEPRGPPTAAADRRRPAGSRAAAGPHSPGHGTGADRRPAAGRRPGVRAPGAAPPARRGRRWRR